MSTLLPPTSETLHHVLTQGGISTGVANAPDPKFESLCSEMQTHIMSASFQHVLETCLDQATETLFSGLRKHVFGGVSGTLGFEEQDDEVRERLAAMLPGLARWCHLALEGLPNEMVDVSVSSFRFWLFVLTIFHRTCRVSEKQQRSPLSFILPTKIVSLNCMLCISYSHCITDLV